MDSLEQQLRNLKKADPSPRFCRLSKNRLLFRIAEMDQETWFSAFVSRLGRVSPSALFLQQARVRLMERVAFRPAVSWLFYLKRATASVLVMMIAVLSTLFFVDGKQIVSASEDTYVEVLAGTATLKRADRLEWNTVDGRVNVAAGDLIKVEDGSEAVVHFFDDTELRLGANSLLLLSQIAPSPAFSRQAVIEVSLNEGQAWAQTLNVQDGFARLTIVTRDAIVKTLNNSFDISTRLHQPTMVRVFNNDLSVERLQERTFQIVDSVLLSAGQKVAVTMAPVSGAGRLAVVPVADADRAESWVADNLSADHNHLVALREREFETLREAVGVLPGQMLYPIKLAKERLQLALSFSDAGSAKIDIANKRLNEAIVLLRSGNQQKALEALVAYQSITRDLVNTAQAPRADISNRIIAKNQKALVAALASDPPVSLVAEALNTTKELIAENPLERQQIRLQNSVERLNHVRDLIALGDIESAKASLAQHRVTTADILTEAAQLTDLAQQKMVLNDALTLRQTESQLLDDMVTFATEQGLGDAQLSAMLLQADQAAKAAVAETEDFIAPLAPELVYRAPASSALPANVQAFMDRLQVYKTWQGQKNQLARLMKEQPQYLTDVDFLNQIKANTEGRTQDLVNAYLLDAQRIERLRTHKAVQQKIDRSKRLRNQ